MSKDKTQITRLTDLAASRSDVLNIDPKLIHISEGFNYRNFKLRQNKEHVAELKESIRANGVLNPLWVQFDKETRLPVLVAGETRLRAVLELLEEGVEILAVPCIQKKGSEADILFQSLTENTGKPPSQWEVGQAYQRLINYGWTEEQIAEKMGQKLSYVKAAITLNEAAPEVKQLLSEMAVTPSHVVSEIKKRGGKATYTIQAQVKAAKEAAAAKAAEREARKAAAAESGEAPKKKRGRPVKEDKPVVVKREKKAGGQFIKTETLKLITSALKAAAKSDNIDVSMPAEAALDALKEKE